MTTSKCYCAPFTKTIAVVAFMAGGLVNISSAEAEPINLRCFLDRQSLDGDVPSWWDDAFHWWDVMLDPEERTFHFVHLPGGDMPSEDNLSDMVVVPDRADDVLLLGSSAQGDGVGTILIVLNTRTWAWRAALAYYSLQGRLQLLDEYEGGCEVRLFE